MKRIDENVRQQVIAALMAGLSVADAGRRYNLPHSTVSRIKTEIKPRLDDIGQESRSKLDDLLLDAMHSNFQAQKRITDHCSKPEYLDKQNAEQVAKLFETFAKHSLEVISAANESEGDEAE